LGDFKPKLKGVKDAYLKLKKFFKNIGLKSAKANPNLFIGNKVYILLFVNNILIVKKC